eukprot:s1912_g4.t1
MAALDQIKQVDTLCATGKTLLVTLEEVAANLDSFEAASSEPRLRRVEYDMAEMKAAMYDMLRDMKDLHKIAEEAINVHDDLGNDVIDTHYELATVIPELSRLAQLVKHRVDEQNFILQCVFYSMDEQFLLLCDLANIIEEAWQQEVFREMQAKLDRYERDEPSPRLLKSREEEEVPQPAQTQPPPFSQKQQREILEEFQRQQEENLRQQREMEAEALRQERLQARQNRRSSSSRPREAAKAAPSAPPTHPKKSKTSPLGRMMAHFRSKMSSLWRGRDAVTAFDGEGKKIVEEQTERLLTEMKDTLAATHNEPVAVRRKVFRELQRKLHPDKNAHCREAAKIAFQQLMDQQSKYLKEVA